MNPITPSITSTRPKPRMIFRRMENRDGAGDGDGMGKVAEEVGFEPTEPCGSPVFKTGAIDRSATPPLISGGTFYPATARGQEASSNEGEGAEAPLRSQDACVFAHYG